ncbi:Flp pilus assembly protein CpaB [Effusibacillus lacus]|uniref:Flp pilus assembly protein CpaB n=1 Tax=Effusibacillus lacus TaxID=1348429 RepID=A0A292YSS7_9BACL|nr:Flp pilus assembly protein CpaB [Effusibacillus lacus]TCS70378.1 Flp pilus assembly protein CpaB [Effusibacillus lacus]GAX91530.1 Flp pilus assembly protein CpaB [Effusibacillus lacus]
MKTKTIWVWAVVFGAVATGTMYLFLFNPGKQPASQTKIQTNSEKKDTEEASKSKQSNNQPAPNIKDGGVVKLSLAPGKRAISIAVNEVQGVSGFITPGAYVDVVVMVPTPEGENASAQILLQNVRVLAVGQLNTTPENSTKVSVYRTVTLEVLPIEGSALAFAAQKGAVSLMLRAPGDSSATANAHITLDQLNKGVISR